MVDDKILAYVAGLIDGEGSIVIGVSKPCIKRRVKSPIHFLQISISNTNKDLLDWLKEIFGGVICNNSHNPRRKGEKPCWSWRTTSKQSKDFLKLVYPFLRIKKERARIGIEFQEKKGFFPGPKLLTSEQIKERDWYKQEIQKY